MAITITAGAVGWAVRLFGVALLAAVFAVLVLADPPLGSAAVGGVLALLAVGAGTAVRTRNRPEGGRPPVHP